MSDNLFRMRHTDAIQVDLNDFHHQVERIMENHKDDNGFPTPEEYQTTQAELDDYLFERQAILDSKGTERSRYTVAGIMIALPVIVLSAFPDNQFPWGEWSLFVAVGIGLALFLLYLFAQKALIAGRLAKLDREYPKQRDYVNLLLTKYQE